MQHLQAGAAGGGLDLGLVRHPAGAGGAAAEVEAAAGEARRRARLALGDAAEAVAEDRQAEVVDVERRLGDGSASTSVGASTRWIRSKPMPKAASTVAMVASSLSWTASTPGVNFCATMPSKRARPRSGQSRPGSSTRSWPKMPKSGPA